MELELQDKVAVVTGASRGIGLAVTEALAAEGARVVAGARTPGAAREGVLAVPVDLGSPDGARTLIGRAIAEFGGVDVLVNNLGAARPRLGGFMATSDDDWTWTLDINLLSAVRACRAALPSLIERRGAIVNVSSVSAWKPDPPVLAYSAAKAAMTNFSKALANEFGPQGVRVNTVSPGPVATDMWTGEGGLARVIADAGDGDVDAVMDGLPEHFGASRFTTPREVATLVVLLASGAAANVAGSDYVVDGGLLKTT